MKALYIFFGLSVLMNQSALGAPIDCFTVFVENSSRHRNPSLSNQMTRNSLDRLRRFAESRVDVDPEFLDHYSPATARKLRSSQNSSLHKKALMLSQINGILDNVAKPEGEASNEYVHTIATTIEGKENISKFVDNLFETKRKFLKRFPLYDRFKVSEKAVLPASLGFSLFIGFAKVHAVIFFGGSPIVLLPLIIFYEFVNSTPQVIEYFRDFFNLSQTSRFLKNVKNRSNGDLERREWSSITQTSIFFSQKVEALQTVGFEADIDQRVHQLMNGFPSVKKGALYLIFKIASVYDNVSLAVETSHVVWDSFFYVDTQTGEPCLTIVSRVVKKRPPLPQRRKFKVPSLKQKEPELVPVRQPVLF